MYLDVYYFKVHVDVNLNLALIRAVLNLVPVLNLVVDNVVSLYMIVHVHVVQYSSTDCSTTITRS